MQDYDPSSKGGKRQAGRKPQQKMNYSDGDDGSAGDSNKSATEADSDTGSKGSNKKVNKRPPKAKERKKSIPAKGTVIWYFNNLQTY